MIGGLDAGVDDAPRALDAKDRRVIAWTIMLILLGGYVLVQLFGVATAKDVAPPAWLITAPAGNTRGRTPDRPPAVPGHDVCDGSARRRTESPSAHRGHGPVPATDTDRADPAGLAARLGLQQTDPGRGRDTTGVPPRLGRNHRPMTMVRRDRPRQSTRQILASATEIAHAAGMMRIHG